MKVKINVRKTTKKEKKEFLIGASVIIIAILIIKRAISQMTCIKQ